MILHEIKNPDDLIQVLNTEPAMIYGTGKLAQEIFSRAGQNSKLQYFLCSAKYKNPIQFCGLTVLRIEKDDIPENSHVICAVVDEYMVEVLNILMVHSIKNIYILSEKFKREIISEILYPQDSGLKLNVGAGLWYKSGWTNLDYPSEHYHAVQEKNPFVPYNMRGDVLPFQSGEVMYIYTSHVIEHVEDN